jgi:proline dehydrogenase
MNVMRRVVLGVAKVPAVHRLFEKNRFARGLVDRFVAGETLDAALAATRELAAEGIVATLDQLGENVATVAEAEQAVSTYTDILHRMHAAGQEPNISVKLTMLGLDLGDDIARENMVPILKVAQEVRGFVRIDMEGSDYTARTMEIFCRLHDQFPDDVGIVIQTYLRRAAADVEAMIERGARVRLVKGAYAEPETVAYQTRREIDENFVRLAQRLLEGGRFPAIATHDPDLIQSTIEFAQRRAIAPEHYEFQMLYGVRRAEQRRLKRDGFGMRVYVPYGTEWYPYFTRRIAERPANALFVLRQLRER